MNNWLNTKRGVPKKRTTIILEEDYRQALEETVAAHKTANITKVVKTALFLLPEFRERLHKIQARKKRHEGDQITEDLTKDTTASK